MFELGKIILLHICCEKFKIILSFIECHPRSRPAVKMSYFIPLHEFLDRLFPPLLSFELALLLYFFSDQVIFWLENCFYQLAIDDDGVGGGDGLISSYLLFSLLNLRQENCVHAMNTIYRQKKHNSYLDYETRCFFFQHQGLHDEMYSFFFLCHFTPVKPSENRRLQNQWLPVAHQPFLQLQ